jgi:hypothetical protein
VNGTIATCTKDPAQLESFSPLPAATTLRAAFNWSNASPDLGFPADLGANCPLTADSGDLQDRQSFTFLFLARWSAFFLAFSITLWRSVSIRFCARDSYQTLARSEWDIHASKAILLQIEGPALEHT